MKSLQFNEKRFMSTIYTSKKLLSTVVRNKLQNCLQSFLSGQMFQPSQVFRAYPEKARYHNAINRVYQENRFWSVL